MSLLLLGSGNAGAAAGGGGLQISGTPVTTGIEYEHGVGSTYAGFTASASGGTPPYTYSIQSGALPSGITLNASSGAVSGTPAFNSEGVYSGIVIRVTDDNSDTADLASFAITISYKDPYFSNVKLLIGPSSGADGSTTIPDEGPLARGNATVVGDAQIDTGISVFGRSVQFDGTGDLLSYADSDDWDLSDGNTDEFTIEARVRFAALGTTSVIVGQRPTTGTPVAFVFQKTSTNLLQYGALSDGTTFNILFNSGATSLAQDTTYHLMVDKDASNKFRLYIDGVMRGSQTPADGSIFNAALTLGIGARSGSGGDPMNGRIEELRITKGNARCANDGGFTVSARAHPRS